MQGLRKLVLLLATAYFLFLIIVITNLLSIDFLDREFTRFNPENFFKVLTLVGAALLTLSLAVEQSYVAFMRRRVTQLEATVNQLKATLYDQKQANTRNETSPRAADEPPTRPSTTAPRPPDEML